MLFLLKILTAIVLLLSGIIALVLGIINKKETIWTSGILIFFVSLFLFYKGITEVIATFKHKINYIIDQNPSKYPAIDFHSIPNDTLFFLAAEGLVRNNDTSRIIQVYESRFIKENYKIEIQSITSPDNVKHNLPIIKLHLLLQKPFSGFLTLKAYADDDAELGTAMVEIRQTQVGKIGIEFIFTGPLLLSDIKYCALTYIY